MSSTRWGSLFSSRTRTSSSAALSSNGDADAEDDDDEGKLESRTEDDAKDCIDDVDKTIRRVRR